MVQLPQRLHERTGEAASAVSSAAAFADLVFREGANSLHTIMLAIPTERRHS
jgi:hypothetical protein